MIGNHNALSPNEARKKRGAGGTKGLPWSDAEKAALRHLWLAGQEIAVIAATLGRSRSGSSAMAEKLGLPPRGYSKRVKPIQLRRV